MYEYWVECLQQLDFVSISIICLCVYLFFNDDNTRPNNAGGMQNIDLDTISELSIHSDSTELPDSDSEMSCSDMTTFVDSETSYPPTRFQVDLFSPDANQIY
jgi:hypothetical protein